MTAQDAAQKLVSDLAPRLSELGFEAFVLTAYHRRVDANDRDVIERHVIVNSGNNIPMQDGLRPMVIMASRWKEGQL